MKFEIEVKAKITDISTIVSKLGKIGCALSEPIIQDDYIFNQKGVDLNNHEHNTPVLRIREQNGKIFFTLKKNRSSELDCVEKEIEVSDRNELKDIIELLGFEQTVEVHKRRRKGNYGNYEICLDEVQELGSFIEVEKMSDEDGEKVQNELFEFLKMLGVNKEDRVSIGYDTQIWLKHNEK
ncbi:MAG: class IV adenylate cyclase [Candidatus Kaiserbacteria bacterium]|nr:class IV adenylate cyclase [Candidatus Kaiserbacteria bacterium]